MLAQYLSSHFAINLLDVCGENADLSDEGGKQMYISKVENVLSYLKQMNIWDGKVVAIGYGMGACGLLDYVMRDTTAFNVTFGFKWLGARYLEKFSSFHSACQCPKTQPF